MNLLVDDEALLRIGFEGMLKAGGQRLICVADGPEAPACLAQVNVSSLGQP